MKNNHGFTLIETMVALLILGILGLMASQGLGGAFRVKDSVEGQIKEAAQTFKQVLEAAAHFGGEEVIAI